MQGTELEIFVLVLESAQQFWIKLSQWELYSGGEKRSHWLNLTQHCTVDSTLEQKYPTQDTFS